MNQISRARNRIIHDILVDMSLTPLRFKRVVVGLDEDTGWDWRPGYGSSLYETNDNNFYISKSFGQWYISLTPQWRYGNTSTGLPKAFKDSGLGKVPFSRRSDAIRALHTFSTSLAEYDQ